ncbi:pentapeptide repeat-containing protein [Streptomyces aureus]
MDHAQRLSLLAAALPGLTALVALLLTWMSVEQTRDELRIAQQGQITSRFTAAIRNLGSDSEDERLGGIHALQRIMQDSARDQPTIISVLTAYTRRHARVPKSGFAKEKDEEALLESPVELPVDVEAVLNVLADRSADHDNQARLDLTRTDLRGAAFRPQDETSKSRAPFRTVNFSEADLRHSLFKNVDLRKADFTLSNLTSAQFDGVDLSGASLTEANLTQTTIWNANLTGANLDSTKLHNAQLDHAVNLTKANLVTADLTDANLEKADLRYAALIGANLKGAYLGYANLRGARLSNVDQETLANEFGWYIDKNGNLTKAILTGANLTNADLRGVDFTRADLTGANLANADLRDANLTLADLTDANVRGAKLARVKRTGTILDGTQGLPPSIHP